MRIAHVGSAAQSGSPVVLDDGFVAVLSDGARVTGDAPYVVLTRRIEVRDGRTVSATAHAIPAVAEQRVHYAPGHRVVLAGPRLLVCDANDDRLEDHGELHLPPAAHTAVTPDGTTLIVVAP